MSVEEEVRAASRRFYEALNQLCNDSTNAALMSEAWHHDLPVSSAHPMGEWIKGWEPLWASWQEFAEAISKGSVEVRDLAVVVVGDLAYTTGIEDCAITMGNQEARWSANVTNIYQRHHGIWKIVHHHSDKSPAAEKSIDALAG